jgi:hypothetical protein
MAGLFDMVRLPSVAAILMLLSTGYACAGEMVTFRELESYFYADGKMERSEGQFEIVYYVEEDTITRIKVFDLKNNETHYDETTFVIERKLRSDPTKGLAIQGKGVVRAIGMSGIDGVEILSITGQFMQSVKSVSNYFVISRLKRIN